MLLWVVLLQLTLGSLTAIMLCEKRVDVVGNWKIKNKEEAPLSQNNKKGIEEKYFGILPIGPYNSGSSST